MERENAVRRRGVPHDRVMTWIGASVMIFGCVLIGVAIAMPPPGEIHNSVLLAFGEISTFSATVMGIASGRRPKE